MCPNSNGLSHSVLLFAAFKNAMTDYSSTARALALPVSPPRSPNIAHQGTQASWVRSSQSLTRNNQAHGRRRSSFIDRCLNRLEKLWRRLFKMVEGMTSLQLAMSVIAGIVTITLAIVFLVFSEKIFAWLEPVAEKWKNLRGGWLILWAMTFATAFPPVIGYSTCLTLAGFVYGFPWG